MGWREVGYLDLNKVGYLEKIILIDRTQCITEGQPLSCPEECRWEVLS